MNVSTFIGFAAAILVFLGSVLTATSNRAIFLDQHGIMIVVGGTFAAGAICFPIFKIIKLGTLALKRMFFGYRMPYQQVIKKIIEMGDKSRTDANYLKKEVEGIKVAFLKDAIKLLNDGMTEDQLREILEQRIETHTERFEIEANIFKTLSKFPPAFGLLGTTLGMIALLQKLGGENAAREIGPAMSIGLVATLYGISIANFLLIPIGENLSETNREETTLHKIIVEGVIMIKNKMHPLMIEEKLNSYLLPEERISTRGQKKNETANASTAKAS